MPLLSLLSSLAHEFIIQINFWIFILCSTRANGALNLLPNAVPTVNHLTVLQENYHSSNDIKRYGQDTTFLTRKHISLLISACAYSTLGFLILQLINKWLILPSEFSLGSTISVICRNISYMIRGCMGKRRSQYKKDLTLLESHRVTFFN